MTSRCNPGAIVTAISLLAALVVPARAAAPTDACALLTQAQVTAAVGVPMAAGTHVTSTFTKTCTWAPAGGATAELKDVTLNLQTAEAYEGGKSMMERTLATMKAEGKTNMPSITPATGIGDDAYYMQMGNILSLLVKKGNAAFKIVIYGSLSGSKGQAAEKELAQQVLSKL